MQLHYAIICLNNGSSPVRHQIIIRTNDDLSLIGHFGTNFSERWIEILTFSLKKKCFNISSANWYIFSLGLNVLTSHCGIYTWHVFITGPWFNIKMSSYQYRKSHCGDKTILRPSYLHNGISYTGKMTSLYWIGTQVSSNSQGALQVTCHSGMDMIGNHGQWPRSVMPVHVNHVGLSTSYPAIKI